MSKPGIALQTLRQHARQHYLACLYLPEVYREDVATLWAFDAEIRRIPALVSEPMPGEIRLQWWRDLIKSGNNSGSGPLAGALMDVIAKHDLPRETFHTYLDARIFDLYNDPMPDTGTFEGYLGETVSPFFLMSALIAGAERSTLLADVSGHAGMALGISRMLSSCASDRAHERVYFPSDLLSKYDLDSELWLATDITQDHTKLVQEICSLGQYHLTFTRAVLKQVPQEVLPVFLPIAVVGPILKKAMKSPVDAINKPLDLAPLHRVWIMMRAAMRTIP